MSQEDSTKSNTFDLFIPEGFMYYGENAPTEKIVGKLEILSEVEFKGNIKLCLEKYRCCCGNEGENFTLRKINNKMPKTSNIENQISFTVKNHMDLPKWFDKAEYTYMLNDPRLMEKEEYIGGYMKGVGDVFFINNKEIVFPETPTSVYKLKYLITKTLISGDYKIKITWDERHQTGGAYNEGTINLYYKDDFCSISKLIFTNW